MAKQSVYVISVAAELSGMHPQTLRIYERKGLVHPARTAGGSRRYTDEDVALLLRISQLTSEGMNLVGVKRVLELERKVAELESLVAEQRRHHEQLSKTLRHERSAPKGELVPVRQSLAIYKKR